MRCLWGDEHGYEGEFVKFVGALSYPKPVKGNRLPVLVGGQTAAALKRAAAYGTGWCGFNLTPAETMQAVNEIRQLRAAEGPRPRPSSSRSHRPTQPPRTTSSAIATRGSRSSISPPSSGSRSPPRPRRSSCSKISRGAGWNRPQDFERIDSRTHDVLNPWLARLPD